MQESFHRHDSLKCSRELFRHESCLWHSQSISTKNEVNETQNDI